MITKKLVLLLAAGVLVAGAQSVKAASIGTIDVGAWGSHVVIDKTANTVSFIDTQPLVLGNANVNNATDDFAGLFGLNAIYANFTYDPLTVANPIWQTVAPGVASFDLLAITSVDEAGVGLVLTGTGTIHFGAEDIPGFWSLSADQSTGSATFTFSSQTTTGVPDGGATAMLLGLGVLGIATIRRKLS